MKIGIILDPYGEKEPAGLGRALIDLVRAMVVSSPQDEFLLFAKGDAPPRPDISGDNWSLYPLGRGLFWRERGLARAPRADAYLYYTPVLPVFARRGKSVVIALDFAYLTVPARGIAARMARLALRLRHGYSLRSADTIIAISEATKKDVVRFFGIPEGKIRVVHFGFNPVCDTSEERVEHVSKPAFKGEVPVFGIRDEGSEAEPYRGYGEAETRVAPENGNRSRNEVLRYALDAPEKFFLFVGVVKERKNVLAIVQAFEKFARHRPEYRLLLAGKAEGEYADAVRHEAARGDARDRIQFLGYRSDAEIAYLYRRAVALVYPSRVEGFGLPILEAMACGTAVITSNASSLPEVAGDAALLVDPEKIEEIAAAMERIAAESDLRRDLIVRGKARTSEFTWPNAAQQILSVLHML